MTEKQDKHFYWPRWWAACRANAWRVQKGRLDLAGASRTGHFPEPANTVIIAARGIAEQEHRAVTLDDLRHATHFVACGRNCSHFTLRNGELTRWGWLMALLINPDDLKAMNHWLHPELDEEESLDARLGRMPEAIVRAICFNRFQTRDWRNLGTDDKLSLMVQVKNRLEREHKPFSTPKERVAA